MSVRLEEDDTTWRKSLLPKKKFVWYAVPIRISRYEHAAVIAYINSNQLRDSIEKATRFIDYSLMDCGSTGYAHYFCEVV